jgi:hypothetical protein
MSKRSDKIKAVLTPKQEKIEISDSRNAAFIAHADLIGIPTWTEFEFGKCEIVIQWLKANGDFTQCASLIDKKNRELRKK